jgi:hypothetical protein
MDNGTETRLVQANRWEVGRGCCRWPQRQNAEDFSDTALAKEVMRGSMNQGFVFFLGAAQFRKREFAFHREASVNFVC